MLQAKNRVPRKKKKRLQKEKFIAKLNKGAWTRSEIERFVEFTESMVWNGFYEE